MLTSISYTTPPSMLMASHIVNGSNLSPPFLSTWTTLHAILSGANFEYTWIGTTGQRALFPPSAWNHHDASLALLPQSSNMAEGIMSFVVWFAAATQPFAVFWML